MSETRRGTRKRSRSAMLTGPFVSSYGIVTLPKGMRLYHTTYQPLCEIQTTKPMVFMTFHPSEWGALNDAHVAVVELQRDVKLFFMVSSIINLRVFSALNSLLGGYRVNLQKQNSNRIREWIPHLKREGLDGWFSSIESKATLEVAICSDSSAMKIVGCNPIERDWRNLRYRDDETIIPKDWGSAYTVSSFSHPIQFRIHSRFRPMIERYKRQIAKDDPGGTALSLLLENADIQYFDGPVKEVRW